MNSHCFDTGELAEMQQDWQRTHSIRMVAELHACTKSDVIQALDLAPAECKDGRLRWEDKHPDEAARLCALADGGMGIAKAAAEIGISKSYGAAVYKRMKAKGTAMENKAESSKKQASSKYEQGLLDLEDFITCFQSTGLLDADALTQLKNYREEARSFVLGMKFAEAYHE